MRTFAFFIAWIFAVLPARAGGPVVVELFTSQACPMCPAADALLGELDQHDDVIALSFPVSYWDSAAWKDTLARPEHVLRQKAYAASLGHRRVYTPEIVVAGAHETRGYDEAMIVQTIETARSAPSGEAGLQCREGTAVASISGGDVEDGAREAVVLLIGVEPAPVTVAIGGGANAGRENDYHAVVRTMREVGVWSGGKARFEAPIERPDLKQVLLVQEPHAGRILAAAECPAARA